MAVRKSTVIKADVARPMEGVALKPFDFVDMMGEVREAMERARVEAARIVQQARDEEQAIREKAREEGYQAGRAEGEQAGREAGRAEAREAARAEFAERQKSLIESCQDAIASINADRSAWQASARNDLVDLAMAIARRVVHCVGQRERQAVLANLDEAVRLAGERSDVTIMVSPADEETARDVRRVAGGPSRTVGPGAGVGRARGVARRVPGSVGNRRGRRQARDATGSDRSRVGCASGCGG